MKEKLHGVITKYIKYNNTITKKIMNNGYCMRTYKNCPPTLKFKSEMISDDNQNFCGGWTMSNFDSSNNALFDRCWKGLKPMGVIYTKDYKVYNQIKSSPFNVSELFLPNKMGYNHFCFANEGTFNELFDLDSLYQDYSNAGIKIDLSLINGKELKDFFDKWDSPPNELWITGLILGYPIENTISIYKQ